VGAFTVLQLGIQGLNAITGILIVRYLPPGQYAWFTIVLSMNAAFHVLTEPVTSTGLQALAGPVYQDRRALSGLVFTSMQQRWKWLLASAILLLPWTFYLLINAEASPAQASLLIVAALLAVPATSGLLVQGTVPRLLSQVKLLQVSELFGSLSRIVLGLLALVLAKLGWVVMAAYSVAHWCQFWKLRHDTKPMLQADATYDGAAGSKLDATMRSMALHSLFLCFQALVGIWLLGLFGSVTAVAELGALSRLAILLAPLGALAQQMAVPALARCGSMKEHRSLFLILFAIAAVTMIALVFVCYLAPWSLLWILGPTYQHLGTELPVAMAFFALTTLNTILWWQNTARGWTKLSSWVPPLTLLVLALAAWGLQPITLMTILLFQLLGQLPSLILALTQTYLGWRTPFTQSA
jgi:hypothetical protein